MKKLLITLAALLLLTACKQETTPQQTTTDTLPQQPETAQNDALPKLAAQMSGLWISDSYLAGIERTKSVYSNREYSTSMLGFTLYKDKLATGITNVEGFSAHEGGYYWPLKFNAATNRFDYDNSRKQDYDEGMELSLYPAGNNLIEIAHVKPSKKERYRRIAGEKGDINALDYELNHILFEGTYTDRLSGKTVTFTRNGTMKGMEPNLKYMLQYDFGEGMESDYVMMYVNSPDGSETIYHYKINDNTLNLYAVTGDHDRMEYIISPEPAFVLVKE